MDRKSKKKETESNIELEDITRTSTRYVCMLILVHGRNALRCNLASSLSRSTAEACFVGSHETPKTSYTFFIFAKTRDENVNSYLFFFQRNGLRPRQRVFAHLPYRRSAFVIQSTFMYFRHKRATCRWTVVDLFETYCTQASFTPARLTKSVTAETKSNR